MHKHRGTRRPTPVVASLALLGLTVAGLVAVGPEPAAEAANAFGRELVVNGGFEQGKFSWRTNNKKVQRLRLTTRRPVDGAQSAVLRATRPHATVVLNDKPNTTRTAQAGERYQLSAWVRTNRPRIFGEVRIRAVKSGLVQRLSTKYVLPTRKWTRIVVDGTVRKAGSSLDINVVAWNLPKGTKLFVDNVSLIRLPAKPSHGDVLPSDPTPTIGSPSSVAPMTTAPTPAPSTSDAATPAAPTTAVPTGGSATVAPSTSASTAAIPTTPTGGRLLSNGCSYSTRGIPSCGAYVGGAYNSNTDPAAWESTLSTQLGVRRVYFSAGQTASAVSMAKADLANGRVTWMSFKPPYSWAEMAAGKGDTWARDLAAKLATVGGPVWVAIHHEPENDAGDIADWTAMQARLAPIFRSAGSNVAFSIILMGWHEFYGDAKFRLENLWPKNTTVDVAGFDIYDEFGMIKNGAKVTAHKKFKENYFVKIQAWAKQQGVAWGLAETGFSAASVQDDPAIIADTYRDLTATGGIAFSYFNTNLHSSIDWRLDSSARLNAYKKAHTGSPTIAGR